MNTSSAESAAGPRLPAKSLVALALPFCLLVVGVAYIAGYTEEHRAAGLTAVLLEFAVWIGLLTVAMFRSPGMMLRISDPYVLMLGLGLNFLVSPGVIWLHGADLERQWFEMGRIRIDIFVQLQWLHVMFMLAFSAMYFALAPRHEIQPIGDDQTALLPRGAPWIVVGLLPFALTVAQRIVTTGSLFATQSYGQVWASDYAAVTATHAEGGSALVATQFLGKVWFLPWLILGIGEGLLLANLIRQRKRWPLLLFAAQAPVLLVLNSGGRSVIAAPFLIALLVADILVGPLRWRWVVAIGGAALFGLNFFGFYRGYRDREFGEAFSMAEEQFNTVSRTEGFSAEGSVMLIKEHFAVAWTDANNYSSGLSYFTESILTLLPQQLVPEKLRFLNTSTFLSREILGSAANSGGGIAGAMIADGYMIGRELGVVVLGAVLGTIAAGVTFSLGHGAKIGGERVGPRLWQVVLLVSWSFQGIAFYRADLTVILSQIATLLVVPALCFSLWVSLSPGSPWGRRVPTAG
ncbi:MAG: hypothetical protein JWM10_1943 [Myxococcaceae bacterium]|nr:hypothetical protein [Myxococcaceae bacterium]